MRDARRLRVRVSGGDCRPFVPTLASTCSLAYNYVIQSVRKLCILVSLASFDTRLCVCLLLQQRHNKVQAIIEGFEAEAQQGGVLGELSFQFQD